MIIFVLVIAIISILLICKLVTDKKVREHDKAVEQKRNETIKHNNDLLQRIKTGMWSFPSSAFYEECCKQNIYKLETEYELGKARIVAEKVIKASPDCNESTFSKYEEKLPSMRKYVVPNGVDFHYFTPYLTEEKLRQYFAEGSGIYKKEQLDNNARIYPSCAIDSNENKIAVMMKDLHGCQKKRFLLNIKLKETEAILNGLPGTYKLDLQKERDWAIMGGIASGIAGPAAGVVTALNTIQNNEKIRQENDRMRELTNKANNYLLNEREKIERSLHSIRSELRDLDSKYVFKETSENICKYMTTDVKITSQRTSYKDNTPVKVLVAIGFVPVDNFQVPEGVKVVVDGTITGKLMVGDKTVADVVLPLPFNGVKCRAGHIETLTAECTHYYGDPDAEYRFELDSRQNVWYMEE